MGRRRKNKAKAKKELSADVVCFNILPRLPLKSINRFRFVSKQWYSSITTPIFAKMQLHHQNEKEDQNQNQYKFLLLSDTTFRTIAIDPNKGIFSFTNVPLPFNIVDYDFDLSIVKSFHGIVCVGIFNKSSGDYTKYSDLILWNPVIGDYKTLSRPGSQEEYYYYTIDKSSFELYYSSCDDDYKLLHINWKLSYPNIYIYSLNSDSWRKVDLSPDFRISYSRYNTALLNEKLYFLVDTKQQDSSYSIIRLDTNTEKLTKIATPFRGNINSSLFYVLRGCIHLNFYGSIKELWRMDGDGDWTKVVSGFPLLRQEPVCDYGLHFSDSDYSFYQVDGKTGTKKILCALTWRLLCHPISIPSNTCLPSLEYSSWL